MSDRLVILLHGVGSDGANMSGLGDAWTNALPRTTFAAPNGPERFNAGYHWFSVIGVTEQNRPGRVEAARAAFDATLKSIIDDAGFGDRLERVALVGFSQGSIMALDAVASGAWPVGAVVAFSGRLASPTPLAPATDTHLLLIHGDADPVMPVGESHKAAETLKAQGMDVAVLVQPGLGHSISAEGAAEAARFIAARIP